MLEHRHQPLASHRVFALRVARSFGITLVILAPSLGLGVLGYHFLAYLPWVDAVLNASMILTGMGPVDPLRSTAAKLFASFYALFSGIVFITSAGVLLAPVAHRVLHRFHLDLEQKSSPKNPADKGAGH